MAMEVKIAASPSDIYCKYILTHPVKIICETSDDVINLEAVLWEI